MKPDPHTVSKVLQTKGVLRAIYAIHAIPQGSNSTISTISTISTPQPALIEIGGPSVCPSVTPRIPVHAQPSFKGDLLRRDVNACRYVNASTGGIWWDDPVATAEGDPGTVGAQTDGAVRK
jgi:hypothetical protein